MSLHAHYLLEPAPAAGSLIAAQPAANDQRYEREARDLRNRLAAVVESHADLERRLQERTVALDRARTELQLAADELGTFTSSVSHDLRAPLSTVQGYVQFFLEDHGEQLPPEGRELLHEALSGTIRMARLIEDLQSYSRLNRQPLDKAELDMRHLVLNALRAVAPGAPGRRFDIRVDELGEIAGDAKLMLEALTQLLSNAVKFTRGRDPSLIEVQRLQQGDERVFSIRDNGAGFDMQYAHKLFGVFQRLHGAAEFEGRGIGLCIAQRIIQRHGGRIWAHATPGEGATFFFTVP